VFQSSWGLNSFVADEQMKGPFTTRGCSVVVTRQGASFRAAKTLVVLKELKHSGKQGHHCHEDKKDGHASLW
jgi:hypothetical protein